MINGFEVRKRGMYTTTYLQEATHDASPNFLSFLYVCFSEAVDHFTGR